MNPSLTAARSQSVSADVTDQGGSDIQIACQGSTATLTLDGTFTASTHERLQELLDWLIEQGCRDVQVELGATVGIDWACLSLLRAARNRFHWIHGRLTVSADHEEVANELMLTGLNDTA